MRQDLLKKFATAEGIAGRLPYSILTKMFRIMGWKRLEVNQMLVFDNINEANLESIVRRIAIIRVQARFFDKVYLEENFPNAEGYGIFPRDADAKAFMTSEVAVAAGHRIQFAFEDDNGAERCRNILVEYARLGGDHGNSAKYVRLACGIRAPTSVGESDTLASGLNLSPSQEGDPTAGDDMDQLTAHLVREMMRARANYLTWSLLRKIAMPPALIAKDEHMKNKTTVWNRIKTDRRWKSLGAVGQAHERLIPLIETNRGSVALRPDEPNATEGSYPETVDAQALQCFYSSECRKINTGILAEAMDLLSRPNGGPGRRSRQVIERSQKSSEQAAKLRHAESILDGFVTGILNKAKMARRRRITRTSATSPANSPPARAAARSSSSAAPPDPAPAPSPPTRAAARSDSSSAPTEPGPARRTVCRDVSYRYNHACLSRRFQWD